MRGLAVVDTNLLALLAIGSASRSYIKMHKRISADFTTDHFDLLVEILGAFEEIVLTPQTVAETSNLIRHIGHPARNYIQIALKKLVETTVEFSATSRDAISRIEYYEFGISDAVLLHLCSLRLSGVVPTLVTIDSALANRAHALGYDAIDYREFFS